MLSLQNITLIAVAVLPGLFFTAYVYQRDKVDAEPVGLLWSLVLLGALSAVPASLLEAVLDLPLSMLVDMDSPLYIVLMSFFEVAVAEEGCKYLMLRLRTWKHPAFDYTFDGIVYGVMVAVGFATLENILYVLENGFGTGVARALLSVPGHVSWGVIMGYYYGRAKAFEVAGDPRQSRVNRLWALLVPILFHGAYDTCAFMQEAADEMMFFVLLGVAALGDVIMVWLVRRESKNDAAFWRPISQVGFAGYAAVQAGVPVQQVYAQQRYAQPVYAQRPPYQQGVQQPPYPQGMPPRPTVTAPQTDGYQGQPAQAMPTQVPRGQVQQVPTWPQQVPSQAYQQPYGAPVGAAAKSFSWFRYFGLRILGYLGVMLGLFVVDVILSMVGIEGIVDEFLIYLLALMVIFAVPYLLILAFAAALKKRRLDRGIA